MESSKYKQICEIKTNEYSEQAQGLENMNSKNLNYNKQTDETCANNKGAIDVTSTNMGIIAVSKNEFPRLNISAATSKNSGKNENLPKPHNAPATMLNEICVHSQVDFMHFLVPDLDRITNASYYWGKMDRYEAERLLDGKEEGTFLLRDSAQEEFLFSVTFRKYGRSLHARIEQNGQKFSFDCHDPCVYTASTITGLLEHYKDPSCVMFFEPMLTIPLHRRFTFSLQQLCRATIVSRTTYSGVNQLELPVRLKTFLKEFHFKQKLCVRPFDDF